MFIYLFIYLFIFGLKKKFDRKPAFVNHDDKLGDILAVFRHTRQHMAVVQDIVENGAFDPVVIVVGIITLEDILEEILEMPKDEFDGHDGEAMLQNRDMDFARLRLLNSKIADIHLSEEEVRAVAAHLLSNVEQAKVTT